MLFRSAVTTCASTLSQAAAHAALDGLIGRGEASGEINDNIAKFWDRRDRVVRALERLDLKHAPADGAMYVFVEVASVLRKNGLDPNELTLVHDLMDEQGVVVIPGRAFGAGGVGWIRLAYTCDRIDEGLRRLAKGLGF